MPLPPTDRLPRIFRIALQCAVALGPTCAAAESVRILVQSSPLAGSQYHSLAQFAPRIKVGDRLTLTREADNRHDPNAVRVDWNGQPLGYLPRRENRSVARALDAGETLEARVAKRRDDPDPWRRVEIAVYLKL